MPKHPDLHNDPPDFPAETSAPVHDADWEHWKECYDEQSWIGRACNDRLPGGGNFEGKKGKK